MLWFWLGVWLWGVGWVQGWGVLVWVVGSEGGLGELQQCLWLQLRQYLALIVAKATVCQKG